MTSERLSDLVGLELTAVLPVEDYFQFVFEHGAARLSIYNTFVIRGSAESSPQSVTCLVGRRLLGIHNDEAAIRVEFDDGWTVEVDTTPDAFEGPEAMTLHVPDKAPVIWN